MEEDDLVTKAQPDTGTLEMIKVPTNKVQLDIEDAPFLAEPEDLPAEEETVPVLPVLAEDPETERKKKKKRLMIILVAGCSLVLALALVTWWIFRVEPVDLVPPVEPKIVVVPSKPDPVNVLPQDHTLVFEPFWVEQKDTQGQIRFLTAKFTLLSKDAKLITEAKGKTFVLRDAFYYYLCNKPLDFFLDYQNAPTIKADLLSIANGYLTGGRLDDVLLESYLMR